MPKGRTGKESDDGFVDRLDAPDFEIVGGPKGANEKDKHQQQGATGPELLYFAVV